MNELRQRIHDDLKGLLGAELYFDEVRRRSYGVDGGWFEVDPLGVVVPRDRDDLCALARYAHDQRIALHPRGGGTTVSGESLGSGLVVDLSRHFRQIIHVDYDRVEVQCGVTLSQLRDRLGRQGRRVDLDCERPEARTIGGLIGTNAAGPLALRYGSLVERLEQVEVVLATGEVASLGLEPLCRAEDMQPSTSSKQSIVQSLSRLAAWRSEQIAHESSSERRLGYTLHRLCEDQALNVERLFAGAHGTLGLVTRARLRTSVIPPWQRVLLIPFGRLSDAASSVPECLLGEPARCELFDWRAIHLAREASPRWRELIPPPTEALLLVQFEGEEPAWLVDQARLLSRRLSRSRRSIGPVIESDKPGDCEELLGLARFIEPLMRRSRGSTRPMPLFRELFLPPEALSAAVAEFQGIFQKYEVDWTLQGAIGPGLLRLYAVVDPSDPAERAKLPSLATALFETAIHHGGGTSGEDGRGWLPGPLYRKQLGELAPVIREIKNIFDTGNLLNPGKTGSERSALSDRPFRRFGGVDKGRAPLRVLSPSLRWDERSLAEEAACCNGCGACRSREAPNRMCPAFRAEGTETATPRAKTVLLRQLLNGELDLQGSSSEDLKEVADLCLNCRMCAQECPSGVDVSRMVLELKAAYAQDRGLTPADWVISRLDFWGQLGCWFPHVFNGVIGRSPARWAIDRLFGLSQHRRWPRMRRHAYIRRAERLGLTRPRSTGSGPRVAYFVDTFANYFDQATAEATVSVLRHCGVSVFVPRKQVGAGMSAMQVGDMDRARDHALRNLRVLGDAVREGYTIVCSDPTATVMLTSEYSKLTDDIDAELVATNTMDLSQYLLGLHQRGQLPSPDVPLPARAGYHQPCHLRSLEIGTPSLALLRLIPGFETDFIDRGCSGMGGIFGLYRTNFRTSLRAGRGLARRLRDHDLEIGVTECGACRLQMEQGATKRSYHPIKVLALGYGLDPGLRSRYKQPKTRHEVT